MVKNFDLEERAAKLRSKILEQLDQLGN